MAERFNATVLKTVVAKVTLSSNLSPSAKFFAKQKIVQEQVEVQERNIFIRNLD